MLKQVFISALGLGLSSILGSAIGLTVKKIPHKWNDIFMGFCAGMMLAASLVCLLLPSVEATPPSGWWQAGVGVVAGVLLIGLMDKFTPHLHHLYPEPYTGRCARRVSENAWILLRPF